MLAGHTSFLNVRSSTYSNILPEIDGRGFDYSCVYGSSIQSFSFSSFLAIFHMGKVYDFEEEELC